MAFKGLTEHLQQVMGKIRKRGKISETDVKEMIREIRFALLEADVNLQVVRDFTKRVRERAIGAEILESLSPAQQIVKTVSEELTITLSSETAELNKSPKVPIIIMMTGLQGAGKTTFTGELVNYLKKNENARLPLIAGDVYRPAAIDQLKVLGQQLDVPIFDMGTEVSPVEIIRRGMELAKEKKNDYVLVNAAGHLHIDETLMNGLKQVRELTQPNEILPITDTMTGQDAVSATDNFSQQLGITGVVITKLDGDTRGEATLSIRSVTGAPIKFVGSGEKLVDLEVFHPGRTASRILSMGDMLILVEEAQQDYDEKKTEELTQKMRENSFDFDDFIGQLDQVMGMGPLEDLIKMIPGINQVPGIENVKVDPKDVERGEAMVYSMTPAERASPDLLNPSRRRRIAAGSGDSVVGVNRTIKQFKESRKVMQQMSKRDMSIPGIGQMFGLGVRGRLDKMAMSQMIRKDKKKKKKRK